MNVLKHISPSQISEYDLCNRKWYIHKIMGQDVPGSDATALGTTVHTSIEDYLQDVHSKVLHPIARPAEAFLVAWRQAVRDGHAVVESEMRRTMRNGIDFVGRVDLRIRIPGLPSLIVDHKTISNADFAKTEDDLQSNTQMLAYAYDEYCIKPQPAIRIAHSSMQTRGGPRHVYTETEVTAPQVMAGWSKIQDKGDAMLVTANASSFLDVPENRRSCHAFNVPCPFLAMCEAHRVKTPNTQEDSTMPTVASYMDSLGKTHPSQLPSGLRAKATDWKEEMANPTFPWPPGGVPTPTEVKPGSLLSPDAADPKGPKQSETVVKPVKSEKDIEKERLALLVSLGWSKEDLEMINDEPLAWAADHNLKREDAEIERDGEDFITKVSKKTAAKPVVQEPVAPVRRKRDVGGGGGVVEIQNTSGADIPKHTPVTVEGKVAESVKEEPTPSGRPSGKDRRPVRAAEKLAALGYPDEVVANLTNPEMHDIIDGNVKYVPPTTKIPPVEEVEGAVEVFDADDEEKESQEMVDLLEQEREELRTMLAERTAERNAAREIADEMKAAADAEREKVANLEKRVEEIDAHRLHLEKELEKSQNTIRSTTVAPATGYAGPTLYVGCVPSVLPAKAQHLDVALAPAMAAAAKNYKDEKGNAKPLDHYGLIPFGGGPKVVASMVAAVIQDFVVEHPVLFVDPASPCAPAVLEVLRPHYLVVQRVS